MKVNWIKYTEHRHETKQHINHMWLPCKNLFMCLKTTTFRGVKFINYYFTISLYDLKSLGLSVYYLSRNIHKEL